MHCSFAVLIRLGRRLIQRNKSQTPGQEAAAQNKFIPTPTPYQCITEAVSDGCANAAYIPASRSPSNHPRQIVLTIAL